MTFQFDQLAVPFVLAISLVLTTQVSQSVAVQNVVIRVVGAEQDADENGEQEEDQVVQDFIEVPMAVDGLAFGIGGGKSKEYMIAVKKLEVMLRLDLQIGEIKSVCDINEQQIKKLKVASKGVAQRQSRKWAKEMDEFQIWGDLAKNENGDDDKKEEDLDAIDLDSVDAEALQWMNISFSGAQQGAEEDKVWKKAVNSVLTAEQMEKLVQVREKRKERATKALVEFFVQSYGSELLLSETQLDELRKVIARTLKSHPAPKSIDDTYNSLMHVASISEKQLKFMSPTQLKRWKIVMGPYGNNGMFFDEVELVEEIPAEVEKDAAEANKDGDR